MEKQNVLDVFNERFKFVVNYKETADAVVEYEGEQLFFEQVNVNSYFEDVSIIDKENHSVISKLKGDRSEFQVIEEVLRTIFAAVEESEDEDMLEVIQRCVYLADDERAKRFKDFGLEVVKIHGELIIIRLYTNAVDSDGDDKDKSYFYTTKSACKLSQPDVEILEGYGCINNETLLTPNSMPKWFDGLAEAVDYLKNK